MAHQVFISYSRRDISNAVVIKQEIEDIVGCSCWMDMDGIESGSQFEDIIVSAIDNSKVVLFLLSENSMNSRWTKDEIRYAYETQKKIVPINIDGSTPKGWFLFKFSCLHSEFIESKFRVIDHYFTDMEVAVVLITYDMFCNAHCCC